MKYKNIALVANSTWNIYNFRQNVIDHLLSQGHTVSVIAPVDEYLAYKEKYPNIAHYGIRTLGRDSKNPIKDLFLILELMRKYSKLKPDLIIHYTNKPNIFGSIAARFNKIPCIAMVTGLGYPFIHDGWLQRLTSFLYKVTAKNNKRFIFENIADRVLFEERGIITKQQGVSIKGCGVNIDYFKPRKLKPNRKLIFTFIGRLLYDKGVCEFVEAAKIIRQSHPNVRFLLVGDLDTNNPATLEKERLAEWVNQKHIEYLGFKKDVRAVIAQSDCIVLPSYREAIPRSITEAMAMAKPVITTRVAGCEEAVDDGVNGYLVEVKNSNDLAKAFKKLISLSVEERQQMGEYGRTMVLNQFDDRKIAQAIYRVIEEL